MNKWLRTLMIVCVLVLCLGVAGSWHPGLVLEAGAASPTTNSTANPSDTALGWIVGNPLDGYATIVHTQDGGQTWVRQGSPAELPNVRLNAVWAVDHNNVWAVGQNDDGYGVILRTYDAGAHWVRQGSPAQVPDIELNGVSAVNANVAWVVGFQGEILQTSDGGQNWTRQTGANVPNVQLEGVYAVDELHAWACGDVSDGYGTIVRTTDGGQTWTRPGFDQLPAGATIITVQALDADTLWAVGHARTVMYTDDGGTTWDWRSPYEHPDNFDANGVAAPNRHTLWVVMDYGGIYRSDDRGVSGSWVQQESNEHGHHLIRISALDPQNAWLVGVVSVGGTPLGVVLFTRDGGDHWSLRQPPIDTFWQDITILDGRLFLPVTLKN